MGFKYCFPTQKDTALSVMTKYIKGVDPYLLEKSYEAYKNWIPSTWLNGGPKGRADRNRRVGGAHPEALSRI
jgi:hypothetical protein